MSVAGPSPAAGQSPPTPPASTVTAVAQVTARGELSTAFDALGDSFARHRAWIVGAYLFVLSSALAAVMIAARNDEDRNWTAIGLFALTFIGTQALFLLGGGRIRIGTPAASRWRYVVASIMFVALMSVLIMGMVALLAEFAGTDSLRPGAIAVLAVSWLSWLVVALVRSSRRAQRTVLGAFVGALLVTSWVEFVTALGVRVTRSHVRPESCPCEKGSFATLLLATPILVWSIGPAIVLLVMAESKSADAQGLGLLRRMLPRLSRTRRGGQP